MVPLYLDSIAVFLCVLLCIGIWRYRKALRLPPGPPATFFGNAHHIYRTEEWKTYKELADQYGPMICLWMFNSETFVLNDYETATALLDQRSSIYSSRPTSWMAGVLTDQANNVFLTKTTNPRFKIYRTLLHKTLNPRAIQTYRALQIAECQNLLRGLLETPDNFIDHLRRNAIAVIMSVAYGYRVESHDDDFVNILETSLKLGGALTTPGKYWVEYLPILRHVPEWFPGAEFKRVARRTGLELGRLGTVPFNWAKSQVFSGSYDESFISNHMNDKGYAETEEEKDDILKWCAASLYVGGGDTTVSVLTSFFFLMAHHPDIQERARKEIDSVLGENTATHDDRQSLPYVNAMIKEVLRWGSIVPLALTHQVTEDDHYNGYFIPKDTGIIANIWAMAHDEKVYPNPHSFDPTRFLGEKRQRDPMKYIFGFGRRICPGLHLAEAALFLSVTNILSNFVISKKRDADGHEIQPEATWVRGLIAHLKPFPCQITPRSPDALRSMLFGDSKLG